MIRTSSFLTTRANPRALALALVALLVVLLGFDRVAFADAGPNTCTAAGLITNIPPADLVAPGDTTGATNNVGTVPLGCNGRFTQVAGGEVVFPIQINPGNAFDITVTPHSSWDPSIYVITADEAQHACQPQACTVGRGADDNGGGLPEVLHISGLTPGPYYIVVDSFYTTADSRSAGAFDLRLHGTLGGTPTTTTVSSSLNPSVVGQLATITATVTPQTGPGTPTGNLAFFVDGSPVLTTPLNAGATTLPLTGPIGSHLIVASYVGDSNFLASSASTTQVIVIGTPAVTVSSSPNPSTFGASVVFSANVSSLFTPPAGGTLTLRIDGTDQTSETFTGAALTFTRGDLAAGPHVVTAHYSGDLAVAGGDSAPLTQTVGLASTTTAIASSTGGAAVVFGTPITFTATVTSPGGIPTGTPVVFSVDGATTSVDLDGAGSATLVISDLSVGPHAIHADYPASTNFAGSGSTTIAQSILGLVTATTLSATPEPSDASQNVTFSATVSPSPGAEAAAVIFTVDGGDRAPTATDSGGIATLSTSSLPPGPHLIGARYLGDASHNPSTAKSITHFVSRIPATIALTADLTTAVYLQRITFTGTITPANSPFGSPQGTVEFFDGATSLGTGTLDGTAKAIFPTSFPVGTHTITAKYINDKNFTDATSSPLSITVNKAATQTAVFSASNPAIVDQPLTVRAQVTVVDPGGGTPPGTVTFFEDTTSLGSITVDGTGNGGLQVTLPVGQHTITAVYAANDDYTASTSAPLTQSVLLTGARMSLASSSDPAPRGDAVTFTATLTSVGLPGQPTGDVAFSADGNPLGTATLDGSNTASITTANLSGGSHTITAIYQGDTTFPAGTQAQFIQRITAASTTTAITSTPNPAANAQSVTFTATVTSAVAGAISGTVLFRDGTSVLGLGTVTAGVATFTTNGLKSGSHPINAAYEGNADFAPSASTDHEEVINGPTDSGDAGITTDLGPSTADGGSDAGDAGPGDAATTSPPPSVPQFDAGTVGLNLGGASNDCSCRTVGTGAGSGAMALLAGLALTTALARRRRGGAARGGGRPSRP